MNQDNLTYKNLDKLVQEATNKIPLSYNPKSWEKLSQELNTFEGLKTTSRKITKQIFLNGFLALISLSIISFGLLGKDNDQYIQNMSNGLPSNPSKGHNISPSIELNNRSKNKLEEEYVLYLKENKLLNKGNLISLDKEKNIRIKTSNLDSVSPKLNTQKIIADSLGNKKPFIFW